MMTAAVELAAYKLYVIKMLMGIKVSNHFRCLTLRLCAIVYKNQTSFGDLKT